MQVIRVPKLTRAASAVAATALIAAAGIMAGATAAGAAPHPKLDPTKLSISNKVIAHGKHHADAVSGVLTSDGAGIANETVTLQDRTGVKPRWAVVATGTTATGGTVSLHRHAEGEDAVRARLRGRFHLPGQQSNVITARPVK